MVTKREELEAALAKAEAALANAAINAAKVDGDPAEANANLDKARAYCRRIHAALVKLNLSESIDWSGEWIDTLIEQLEEVSNQLEEVSNRGATASASSRQLSKHAVCGENKRSHNESRRRKPVHRFNIGFSAHEPSARLALERPSLPRQAIGLLALILAYLLYFHIDVQLQIVSLPSIFVWALQ